jgi:hypothetical protein
MLAAVTRTTRASDSSTLRRDRLFPEEARRAAEITAEEATARAAESAKIAEIVSAVRPFTVKAGASLRLLAQEEPERPATRLGRRRE